MRKLLLIFVITLFSMSILLGSNARVSALGNEPAMLVDDDVSIDLFPQRINDFSIARVEGLGTTQPGYLVLIGDSGDKWGVWGSSTSSEDMLNIYRSMSTSSAMKLSFSVGRNHLYNDNSNRELELNRNNFETNLTYGWDGLNSERALSFGLNYGPSNASHAGEIFSNFEDTDFGAVDTTTTKGSGYMFDLSAAFNNRCQNGFFLFNNRYDNISILFGLGGHEISEENSKLEERSRSRFSLNARTFTFNIQEVSDMAQLYYGIGGGLGYNLNSSKNELTDYTRTSSSFYFGSLKLAAGVEASLDNFDLRIGINRRNTLYHRDGNKSENGTTSKAVQSEIGAGANYWINTGLGYNYKNLQINVLLNNNLYNSGPQMIFDSGAGGIFASFDIVYNL